MKIQLVSGMAMRLLMCLFAIACFGLVGAQTGSIVGVAFNDDNGDGIKNPGETARSGVTVHIVGPTVDRLLTTSATGSYSLGRLPEGDYVVFPALTWADPLISAEPSGSYRVVVGATQKRFDLPYDRRCAKLDVSRIICDWDEREGGVVYVTLKVTNVSSVKGNPFDFSYIMVDNLPTGVTVMDPPIWNGANGNPAPLHPGQARLLTLCFAGVAANSVLCFDLDFYSPTLAMCCSVRTCVEVPDCECFQLLNQRVRCLENGSFAFDFTIQSLQELKIKQLTFAPSDPMSATFSPMAINVSIQPGKLYSGTVTISGVCGGQTVCFWLGTKDVWGQCCSKEICIRLPFCNDCTPCEPDLLSILRDYERPGYDASLVGNSLVAVTQYSAEDVLNLINLEDYQSYSWTSGNGTLGTHWPKGLALPPVNRTTHKFWNEDANTPDHEWTINNLGDVFGVCMDDLGNIYVAQTSAYNRDLTASPGRWPTEYLHGRIFKVSSITGSISLFNQIPGGNNAAWNSADPDISPASESFPELGDVCFGVTSTGTRLIFASNLEDGKIYSFDINTGAVISSYDQAQPDVPSAGFAGVGEMVWAVQYHCGRLYYSVWNEDFEHVNTTKNNEIWSIAVNGNGTFVGDCRLEVVMPSLPITHVQSGVTIVTAAGFADVVGVSAPVSDIAFSPRIVVPGGVGIPGGRMMVAERGMGFAWTASGVTAIAGGADRAFTNCWPHLARGMEFVCQGGKWNLVQGTNGLAGVGDTLFSLGTGFRNSSGGVGYDPEPLVPISGNRGPRVWFTSDFMVGVSWYGVQGLRRAGGNVGNSIIVDMDEITGPSPKTSLGDVEMGIRPR